MNKKVDSEPIWHQIVVNDPEGLSGPSVVAFIGPIIHKLGITAVVTADLVGSYSGLQNSEGHVLSRDDFLEKAANAIQYDWAFFFLYSKNPKQEEVLTADAKTAMLQADITVRLADDYYFYVYTKDQKLTSDLMHVYPNAEYKASKFTELNIPY